MRRKIRDELMTTLLYADDQILLTNKEEKLQKGISR